MPKAKAATSIFSTSRPELIILLQPLFQPSSPPNIFSLGTLTLSKVTSHVPPTPFCPKVFCGSMVIPSIDGGIRIIERFLCLSSSGPVLTIV